MIVGIGTDIVAIDRIEAAIARHGERFARRILGTDEFERFSQRGVRHPARGVAFVATRFAAKEAFSKAIGLGMHMPMHWRGVQILNHPSGRPKIVLGEGLDQWMRARGWHAEVSISDEQAFAVAFVVVSKTI